MHAPEARKAIAEGGLAARGPVIRRVDRYELLEQVGSGGMAVVYRGRDAALDREVAVKVLHPHLASRAESRARFAREARAVARLRHPGIVEIFDYAGDGALESYLVTEFVRGRTLRAFAEQEGFTLPEAGALVVRALADALAHAHAAGVIHRDLKPENVLVSESGGQREVKLVDFGIARLLSSDERMTLTGALVGSPNHMAPEIIAGEEADARSDVFSLGTILYWLATGAMPFAAANPTATLRRVIEGEVTEARALTPHLSDELAAVITGAMATAPGARTPTAEALRDGLDGALAAAGLLDPSAELDELLRAPRAYQASLRARLVEATLLAADAAEEAGATPRALRLLNRVLALQPGDARVPPRLERIALATQRRRRRRRVALASGAVAGAALLGLGLARMPWPGGWSPGSSPVTGSAGHELAEAGEPTLRAPDPTPPAPLPSGPLAAAGAIVDRGATAPPAVAEPSPSPPAAAADPAAHAPPVARAPAPDLPPALAAAPPAPERVVAAAPPRPAAPREESAASPSAAAPLRRAKGEAQPAAPPRHPSRAPASRPAVPGLQPVALSLAAASPPRAAAAASPPDPRPAGKGAEATEPSSPNPTLVAVRVTPYAQRALLDGVEVARGEGRVVFALSPGEPHRIQIEHACCFPFVKELAAGETVPGELKERLRPRPARLRIEGDPQARVYVGGELLGTVGDSQRAPLEVSLPAGGESPYEATVALRLEGPGRPEVRTTLRLRAGAEVTFVAPRAGGGPAAPPAGTP